MDFKIFSETLNELENTSKRLEKTSILYNFFKSNDFKDLDSKTRSHIFLTLRGEVFNEWNDKQTGISDALVIKALRKSSGYKETKIKEKLSQIGDLGKVSKQIYEKKKQSVLFSKKMSTKEVYDDINRLAKVSGNKSQEVKINIITKLLNSVEPKDTLYIVRILLETIRAGIGSSTIRDAISWVFFPKIYPLFKFCESCKGYSYVYKDKCLLCKDSKLIDDKKDEIKTLKDIKEYKEFLKEGNFKNKIITLENNPKKAYEYNIETLEYVYSVLNSFNDIFEILNNNQKEIFNVDLILGRPLHSMLFQKAEDVDDAFSKVGKPAAVEFKYDGFRFQLHYDKENNLKKIFTRGLDDVTKQFPELDNLIDSIDTNKVVLDGEIVSYDYKKDKYLPFQTISQRIIRKYNIHKTAKDFPVKFVIFDILHYEGKDMINESFKKRREILEKIVKENEKVMLSESIVTSDKKEAKNFYVDSLSKGNEGVMFKNLDAEYKPGSRVGYGMKLKEALEPLDLVIIKADWGRGKRGKWLTSYTVACKHNDKFLEVGKVSTGLKELKTSGFTFKQMTEILKNHKIRKEDNTLILKPSVVIEVAYEEIQKSPNYDSGYALRFPRFLSLREKSVNEIDTLNNIKKIYQSQKGK
ncbi:MAG: ATP-dependent DNA ligase [Candidatus Woesearchaeota archaeon]